MRVAEFSSSSSSWEDLFPRHTVLNPWSMQDEEVTPLKEDVALDKTTRYLLQLLLKQYEQQQQQQLYENYPTMDHDIVLGTDTDQIDRATTNRCHRAIERLLSAPTTWRGRAARADELLQGMQLFYHVKVRPSIVPPTTFPFPKLIRSTGTDAAWNSSQSIPNNPYAPYPTSATYLMVLRLFAADASSCPRRAHAIVEQMQERYEMHGALELQPNVVHWNQVLSCWAISSHEDKAYQAANLLQQLKRNGTPQSGHNHKTNNNKNNDNSKNNQTHTSRKHSSLVDVSSYAHVLRACAKSDMSLHSKKLGAEIAIKVFKELRNARTDLIPTTYVYAYYLQALSYLTDTDTSPEQTVPPHQQQQRQQSKYPNNRREVEAVAAYQDSIDMGCVNQYVLDNFRQAVSLPVYQTTIGNVLLADHPTTSRLLKRLPASAKRNSKKS